MVSRSWPWQRARNFCAHRGPVAEIRLDQAAVIVETELRRHLFGNLRLAIRGQARQLPLMPQHAEAARDRRVAIGARESRLLQRPGQPAVVAVIAIELAVLQPAHRIADIVADAVGRIDERIVPVGVEQRGERVRLVMIGEMDLRVRAERVVAQEPLGVEDLARIGVAGAAREDREIAVVAPGAARAFDRIAQLAPERHAQMIGRMKPARQRDRVDLVACPPGDAQHLVDTEPRHRLAIALLPREALLGHRRDHLVVVERGGGRVVHAGMDRQDTQRETCWMEIGAKADNTE